MANLIIAMVSSTLTPHRPRNLLVAPYATFALIGLWIATDSALRLWRIVDTWERMSPRISPGVVVVDPDQTGRNGSLDVAAPKEAPRWWVS